MSEAHEIAQNIISKYGKPKAATPDQVCAWITEFWPDWREWIGLQMRDNIADAVLELL